MPQLEHMPNTTHALDWCNLNWSEWITLTDLRARRGEIVQGSGVYRVRVSGKQQIAYIGQSSRVRGRLLYDLTPSVLGDSVPWNDPHTAAPALWAYRTEDGFGFDVSVAAAPDDKQHRNGLEDYLLWRYRISTGTSTLCNYGRFHPRFSRPSNKRAGNPMRRLPEGTVNPNSGLSTDPLPLYSAPHRVDWMTVNWTEPAPLDLPGTAELPGDPGIYKILSVVTGQVLYIGETTNLRSRVLAHARRDWGEAAPQISICAFSNDLMAYQRRELETDLLGGHYHRTGGPPMYQYGHLP